MNWTDTLKLLKPTAEKGWRQNERALAAMDALNRLQAALYALRQDGLRLRAEIINEEP